MPFSHIFVNFCCPHITKDLVFRQDLFWSGRRGSNSLSYPRRHACAGPTSDLTCLRHRWRQRVLLPFSHIFVNFCCPHITKDLVFRQDLFWSGRRGSNSLPPPWQGGALPDELRPHILRRLGFGAGVILTQNYRLSSLYGKLNFGSVRSVHRLAVRVLIGIFP